MLSEGEHKWEGEVEEEAGSSLIGDRDSGLDPPEPKADTLPPDPPRCTLLCLIPPPQPLPPVSGNSKHWMVAPVWIHSGRDTTLSLCPVRLEEFQNNLLANGSKLFVETTFCNFYHSFLSS